MKVIKKTNKGITLIALIVTIIVLLILAGVVINLIFGDSGIFSKAKESAFKTKMAQYREETNTYVGWQVMETMNTDTTNINSGEILKNAIQQGIVTDIKTENVSINIEDILKEVSKNEKKYIVVYKGELCYVSNSEISNNEKQAQWCRELGIKVLEYTEPEGIVVKNGKYELVNGLYLCTPNLSYGFDSNTARYLELENNNLVPGNWVGDTPTQNWYDYKNSKWANIYVETNGQENYYVWIPRYCFKLDQTGQRSDVKFIDVDNNYKDAEDETKNKTWEELEAEQYQVPEAFWFDKNDNGVEDEGEQLAGYWAMKYIAGDTTTPSTINYDMSITQGKITLKNITINANITNSNPITRYTIALNGKVMQTITDSNKLTNISSEIIEFSDLKAGDNIVNITGLNASGEVVGSMTKKYSPAVVNKPDLSAFDKDTTFYVTYDENENEHSTVPISQEMPKYWYEYGSSMWANVVTRNNDLEIYYTWIPRYEFKLNQTNQRSDVQFLKGTTTEVDEGYQIPEAFWFDKNEDGQQSDDEQLTGYWAMKYILNSETALSFSTELVSTSSSIRTKGITGTGKAEGQVYKYYINGEYKGEKTNADDVFEFTGLNSNTQYTILVEVRNSSTNEYIGTVVKQIKTIEANKPDLNGFKEENTYYVLYDDAENETIGEKIKNNGSNMPENWYDYSKSKWANIVVTDGSIENGQIKNATNTTYYTWIPRYEFKITSSQYQQPSQARTEVRFLEGKSKDVDIGFQIPEAFWFDNNEDGQQSDNEQLTGYWAMKYIAGD